MHLRPGNLRCLAKNDRSDATEGETFSQTTDFIQLTFPRQLIDLKVPGP